MNQPINLRQHLPWLRFLKIAFSLFLLCGTARATMATVEQRIIADVMAILPTDSSVTSRMTQLGADGLWSNLTYNQTTTTDTHLQRMRDMARAYKSPTSIHFNSTALRDKFLLAYDGWMTADPNNDNWWWRAIGYPMTLGEAMLVMKSELSAARITAGATQLERAYLPRSNVGLTNTGVNRTDRSYAIMMRAILTNSSSRLTESFQAIGDAILITTLEGMQPDGSYHQHEAQLYTGGYGSRYAEDIPKYGAYGAGTAYTYRPRQIREFTDWLLNGSQWMLRGPLIDHSVLGRGIVNSAQSSEPFLLATQRTISMAGSYRAEELSELNDRLNDALTSGVADPAKGLSGNRMFWRSDYMTHHRPGFMASVKTASTRTVECEVINEQNKKGLHMSDGMLLIHRRGDEYTNLMPVWDWQRLPGTTIEQASYSLRPRPEGATPDWLYGTSTHAGGVCDGNDGALSYIYGKRNVTARKSWFFVGDAIVALGSAINASAATSPVLTSLNQSHLKTPVTYSSGGGAQTHSSGTVTPSGLQWVNHDQTGYFFPGGSSTATIRAQQQSGVLFDINGYGTSSTYTTLQTQDVFSLDINHGTGFTGGTYSYVVVPGLDAAAMASYPLNDLTILSNTSNIQAVKSVSNGLTMANFYGAGTADGITVSHSCSIMVRDLGTAIEVTVSDPKQVITGNLTVQIDRPAAGLIEADGEVTVDQLSPTITMRVNMAGSTGRSLKAKFYTSPTAFTQVTLSPVADGDVLDGSGNTNYGTATTLRTKLDSSSGDWNESYLKFDLSGISGTPVSARLVLNPTAVSATPTLHTIASVSNHAWTEAGLTWNNRPQPAGPPQEPWLPKLGQPVRADVLKSVQGFTGAGGELSLWVAPLMQSGTTVSFASRQHATASLRPTLELTFLRETFTVTFDSNNGSPVSPATLVVILGDPYGPLPVTSREGFSFAGWFTAASGGTQITSTSTVSTLSDHTLHAQWNGPPVANTGPDQAVAINQLIPWTPAETTTAAWYDAADVGTITAPSDNAVSQWNDKSGNNNHLAQGALGNRPSTGTPKIGGLNVVAFNANNDSFMDALNSAALNFDASGGMSAFIVFKSPGYNDQGGNMNAVFGKGSPYTAADALGGYGLNYNSTFNHTYKFADGDIRTLNLGTSYHNVPLLLSTTANHATGAQGFYLNGGTLSATKAATPPRTSDNIGNFRVGGIAPTYAGGPAYGTTTRYADVDVGEIILIPGALTLADRQRVEGYLAHKWGQAANLLAEHPYKSTAPGSFVAIATLNGSATDMENDSLTHTWSLVSGPAAVAFANVSELATTATFTEEGIYTLRLMTSDGFGTSSDDIVITVGDVALPTAFEIWAGGQSGVTFTGDSNGDRVADGLAWLLGAETPSANTANLLPVPHPNNGALSVSFNYLIPAKRGPATLRLQHSASLAPDSWINVAIPDASGTVDGVGFVITPLPDSDFNQIQATVPTSAAGSGGRLFMRLSGEMASPGTASP